MSHIGKHSTYNSIPEPRKKRLSQELENIFADERERKVAYERLRSAVVEAAKAWANDVDGNADGPLLQAVDQLEQFERSTE